MTNLRRVFLGPAGLFFIGALLLLALVAAFTGSGQLAQLFAPRPDNVVDIDLHDSYVIDVHTPIKALILGLAGFSGIYFLFGLLGKPLMRSLGYWHFGLSISGALMLLYCALEPIRVPAVRRYYEFTVLSAPEHGGSGMRIFGLGELIAFPLLAIAQCLFLFNLARTLVRWNAQ